MVVLVLVTVLRRGALAGLLGLAACSPDVYPGTYFCGPELFCPPDQVCDPSSERCSEPDEVEPFACPEGSEASEPDDELAEARALTLGCSIGTEFEGCIADGQDVDVVRLTIPANCIGGRIELNLRSGLALATLAPSMTDGAGAALPMTSCTAFPATEADVNECIALNDVPAEIFVHLGLAPGADCDGECAFNRYAVSALPLP